jgi:integrase
LPIRLHFYRFYARKTSNIPSNNLSNGFRAMPDFLTRRNGTWHFVRRVPIEFAAFDRRGVIKHSTRIKIVSDRAGRRAARVAEKLNQELELYWKGLTEGQAAAQPTRYDEARRRARALGYEYVENEQLLTFPPERRLERLEALIRNGVANDVDARAALLGTEKAHVFKLSKLFEQYEAVVRDEIKEFSPDQRRIWRNGRMRAVERFVELVGDKPITEITPHDGVQYAEWWRDRVADDDVAAKTANKDIGQLSRMLKDVSVRRHLNLPDIFRGLRLRGETEKSRMPFATDFIQSRLLASGALDGLNDDARYVLYVLVETGLRPSEVVNLTTSTIHLNAKIPYVQILPDGRRLKTEDSKREIPLVGVALAAMKRSPHGFQRYRDKSSALSATLNKFLSENGLRPTKAHTAYSLRHSFKDRLIAAEAPDSLIDCLMGHKTYKPRYGKGPSLELKLKFLEQIAFISPDRL